MRADGELRWLDDDAHELPVAFRFDGDLATVEGPDSFDGLGRRGRGDAYARQGDAPRRRPSHTNDASGAERHSSSPTLPYQRADDSILSRERRLPELSAASAPRFGPAPP
jgi:hypothetical protein